MKNNSSQYILPASIRTCYYFGVFAWIGLLGFAIFMLCVGIHQSTDKLPCFVVAAIFGMLSVIYLVIWIRSYRLVGATYSIDNFTASNQVDRMHIKTSVELGSAKSMRYVHRFYVGKGSFDVAFTIYFNDTFSDDAIGEFEYNIYKTLRAIWSSGSVIIPN